MSPVISKVFENVILLKFGHHLSSSCYQFGFKKSYGCRDVLYNLKNIVNHYTNQGSTVNLCTLDISKAFDRVNVFSLITKLISCKLPKFIIEIIMIWYNKNVICVKWNNVFSNFVSLSHGVRQGGVLSPYFWSLVVDDMLYELNNSGFGCKYKGFPIAALMYACMSS